MREEVEEESKGRSPLIYIGALFLIALIILMTVPYYGVRLDPEPSYVPHRDEVFFSQPVNATTYQVLTQKGYRDYVIPNDPVIKQVADKIVGMSCTESKLCHAKVLYYFVRDNYQYISDPVNTDYVEDPKEFLLVGGGDCESGTVLLASLLEAVGVDTQMVFIPNHAFLRIELRAPKKYQKDGWIYLDWTCNQCSFGEIPWYNIEKEARYLEVP